MGLLCDFETPHGFVKNCYIKVSDLRVDIETGWVDFNVKVYLNEETRRRDKESLKTSQENIQKDLQEGISIDEAIDKWPVVEHFPLKEFSWGFNLNAPPGDSQTKTEGYIPAREFISKLSHKKEEMYPIIYTFIKERPELQNVRDDEGIA